MWANKRFLYNFYKYIYKELWLINNYYKTDFVAEQLNPYL